MILGVKEEGLVGISMTSFAKTPLPTEVTIFKDMAPINVEKDLCRVPELSGIPRHFCSLLFILFSTTHSLRRNSTEWEHFKRLKGHL